MDMQGSAPELPEGCISAIMSLTSPEDACRSSAVSTTFRLASESDAVWNQFLPSDYRDILSRSVHPNPMMFSSKKDLYFGLCNPTLIDGGNKSFKLEKGSGKKCYILSARELSITWAADPMYWSWRSVPDSRFGEVAELRTVCWLEIEGRIRPQMLTADTTYGAYLVMKITQRAYGLDAIPSEVSVEVGGIEVSAGTVYLAITGERKKRMELEKVIYGNRMGMLRSRVAAAADGGEERRAATRGDGWVEVELGVFFSGRGNEEVKMGLREVKGEQLKGGLIIEGIEVRPI